MGGRRKALNRMKPSCSEERETTQEARCSRDLRFEQLLREPQESHTRDWSSRDPGRDSTQLDEKEQNWLLEQARPRRAVLVFSCRWRPWDLMALSCAGQEGLAGPCKPPGWLTPTVWLLHNGRAA